MTKELNKVISTDLKEIKGDKIFYKIDNATQYSAGTIIKGKTTEILVDKFLKHWITIFG